MAAHSGELPSALRSTSRSPSRGGEGGKEGRPWPTMGGMKGTRGDGPGRTEKRRQEHENSSPSTRCACRLRAKIDVGARIGESAHDAEVASARCDEQSRRPVDAADRRHRQTEANARPGGWWWGVRRPEEALEASLAVDNGTAAFTAIACMASMAWSYFVLFGSAPRSSKRRTVLKWFALAATMRGVSLNSTNVAR